VVIFKPRPLYPRGKSPPFTHWIGGWVDPTAGMDDVEKRKFLTLLRLELRTLGPPVRSQSLYRLSYPGSPRVSVSICLERIPLNCIIIRLSFTLIRYKPASPGTKPWRKKMDYCNSNSFFKVELLWKLDRVQETSALLWMNFTLLSAKSEFKRLYNNNNNYNITFFFVQDILDTK
jgi:hypothetical protein